MLTWLRGWASKSSSFYEDTFWLRWLRLCLQCENFLVSLVSPPFGLLCHISALRLFSGHSSQALPLGPNAAHACLPSPHLLLAEELQLGAYSGYFLLLLCCPLRFQSFPLTCLWEGFRLCGNFSSFTTPSPGQVSFPKSFVSVFVFYILSYLLSKRSGCLSGCLVFSASVQKLFCGSCSNDLLMRKWSPLPIPLPSWDHPSRILA